MSRLTPPPIMDQRSAAQPVPPRPPTPPTRPTPSSPAGPTPAARGVPDGRLPSHGEERRPRILPSYLGVADHLWLEALVAEYQRFVGSPRRHLDERLAEPLPVAAPPSKLRAARAVLDRRYTSRTSSQVSPALARLELFTRAAVAETREEAFGETARELGVGTGALDAALFADLPAERLVSAPEAELEVGELALHVNHAIVAGLLRRATRVSVEAEGQVRALVRGAKLRGLLCTALPRDHGRSVRLEVSGPFSLFRHTLLYGRALAALVPRAARCDRFVLEAECVLSGPEDRGVLVLRSGDPVVPAAPSERFDSRVEARFARDFSRLARDWELVREPEAVSVGTTLVFPDFLLRHRRQRERRFLLEIVGFWTPEYLRAKLQRLREARIDNLIVCVDEERNCSDADFPTALAVLRYRRRIAAEEVLRRVEP